MNPTLLNIEYQYFGSLDFYKTSIDFTHWRIMWYERWQKARHLNQCHLLGPNGPLLLTVPVALGRGQRTDLKDVRIAYREPWRRTHWRTIHDAYGRSPWFDHYGPTLELLFAGKPEFLIDWNLETMKWALRQLNWEGALELAGTNPVETATPDGIAVGAEAGLPARDTAQGEAGHVVKHAYNPGPLGPDESPYRYAQVFSERHPFRGNLSILDLILCEGPGARQFLDGIAPLGGSGSTGGTRGSDAGRAFGASRGGAATPGAGASDTGEPTQR